jgi:hypothetical protein
LRDSERNSPGGADESEYQMNRDVPELPGWKSLPRTAMLLGVKRQRIYQMAEEGKWVSLRQLFGAGTRPAAYVVSDEEVAEFKAAQEAAKGCPECAALAARTDSGAELFCPAHVPQPVATAA